MSVVFSLNRSQVCGLILTVAVLPLLLTSCQNGSADNGCNDISTSSTPEAAFNCISSRLLPESTGDSWNGNDAKYSMAMAVFESDESRSYVLSKLQSSELRNVFVATAVLLSVKDAQSSRHLNALTALYQGKKPQANDLEYQQLAKVNLFQLLKNDLRNERRQTIEGFAKSGLYDKLASDDSVPVGSQEELLYAINDSKSLSRWRNIVENGESRTAELLIYANLLVKYDLAAGRQIVQSRAEKIAQEPGGKEFAKQLLSMVGSGL